MVTIDFNDLFEKVNETTYRSKHTLSINGEIYQVDDIIPADTIIDGMKISELHEKMVNIKAGTLPLEIRGIHKDE